MQKKSPSMPINSAHARIFTFLNAKLADFKTWKTMFHACFHDLKRYNHDVACNAS